MKLLILNLAMKWYCECWNENFPNAKHKYANDYKIWMCEVWYNAIHEHPCFFEFIFNLVYNMITITPMTKKNLVFLSYVLIKVKILHNQFKKLE